VYTYIGIKSHRNRKRTGIAIPNEIATLPSKKKEKIDLVKFISE
jgi:hypothetical protein